MAVPDLGHVHSSSLALGWFFSVKGKLCPMASQVHSSSQLAEYTSCCFIRKHIDLPEDKKALMANI